MKYFKVSKELYLLCRELERLEDSLDFTVFYSFAEILSSQHFCPAFTFVDVYYELQYDYSNKLRVLNFGERGWRKEGLEMDDKEIESLIFELKSL